MDRSERSYVIRVAATFMDGITSGLRASQLYHLTSAREIYASGRPGLETSCVIRGRQIPLSSLSVLPHVGSEDRNTTVSTCDYSAGFASALLLSVITFFLGGPSCPDAPPRPRPRPRPPPRLDPSPPLCPSSAPTSPTSRPASSLSSNARLANRSSTSGRSPYSRILS
jgi:hypothetical protein